MLTWFAGWKSDIGGIQQNKVSLGGYNFTLQEVHRVLCLYNVADARLIIHMSHLHK